MGTINLVGAVPITLAAGNDYPLEVWNIGLTGTVYASRTPGVTPSVADYTIPPAGHVSVPSGVTLYVCTDANGSASGFWHSDGSIFNLPPTTIFSKASNAPTLLGTIAYNVGTGALAGIQTVGAELDCSNYSSIYYDLRFDGIVGGPITPTQANFIQFGAQFRYKSSPTGSIVLNNQHCQWLMGDTTPTDSDISIQIPVKAPIVQSFITMTKGVTPWTANALLSIYGLNEVINAPRYVSNNLTGELAMSEYFGISQAAGLNVNTYLNTKNGPTNFASILTGGTSSTLSLLILDGGATRFLLSQSTVGTAAGNNALTSVLLPMKPVLMVTSTSAGSTADFSVLQ